MKIRTNTLALARQIISFKITTYDEFDIGHSTHHYSTYVAWTQCCHWIRRNKLNRIKHTKGETIQFLVDETLDRIDPHLFNDDPPRRRR